MKSLIFFAFLGIFLIDEANAQSEAIIHSAWYQQISSLAENRQLHKKLQWRKLMHAEPNFWNSLESQIDGKEFFLSPQGRWDLNAELKATLQAFAKDSANKPETEISQCRFPARYLWLKRQFKDEILRWPDVSCPKFEKFFKGVYGPSASLVFSSFYLNNPSSAFGHSLLRINKEPASDGRRYELLDYGVNYAANMDTENAIVYAFRGLFGFFRGSFSIMPYYYKVREYNNAESRDLWEYEIPLTPADVEMLVAHIWELGPANIDYWYLTENCSYHMFTILEAANPDIHLVDDLKKYVIPSDTVQVLWQNRLVKNYYYRPSIRTQLEFRLKQLNSDETEQVKKIVKDKDFSKVSQNQNNSSKVKVLDTAVDYMDFKFSKDIQLPDSEAALFKNQILSQRSQIPLVSEVLNIPAPEKEMPHEGHGSRRLDLGVAEERKSGTNYLLNYKFALHDLLDPVRGFPEYALINFWDMKWNYQSQNHYLSLKEWTLFEVVSLSPYSWYQDSSSWRFKMNVEQLRNQNCLNCRWFQVSGGYGYTFEIASDPYSIVYLGFRAWGGLNDSHIRTWSGVGPNLIFRWRWRDNLVSYLEHWGRLDFQGDFRKYQENTFGIQWTWNSQWGARVYFVDWGFDSAAQIQTTYYH